MCLGKRGRNMKVKNIAFSGFMAAILMSVSAVADAKTVNLASKGYVDKAVSDVMKKNDVPGLDATFATDEELAAVKKALQDEIAAKLASGDYATSEQLQALQQKVDALGDTGVDKVALEELKKSVQTIQDNYADKSQLSDLWNAVNAISVPTKTSDLDNDSGFVTESALNGLATSEQLQALQKTLEDAIAEKQEKGDYLEAEDLTAINTAISNLESGKADVATVTALQSAINNLGNTYATKTDLTDAEARLQNAINAIEIPNLSEYAKSADVALTYATKAELETKANASALENLATKSELNDLVTSEQLQALQKTLEDAIAEKQEKGDYAMAESLQAISNSLADYAKASTVYTKTEVDKMIADAAAGGNVDLSGYAKASELEALQTLVDDNADEINTLKGAGYQTAGQVETAINTATSGLASKADLADYVKADNLAAVAVTGSYNSLSDRPDIPSISGLATSDELATLKSTLEAQIAQKQAAGEYLEADDLTSINNAINALQSGKADVSAVTALDTAIANLGDKYATDSELAQAIDGVRALIPTVPTNVSAFTNDVGYITSAALTDYATKAEIPSTANLATKAELETKADASALTSYALKADIPSVDEFVTDEQLADAQNVLQEAINTKQAKGDYATVAQLTKLQEDIEALQAGGTSGVDVSGLLSRVQVIEDTYATDADLADAVEAVKALIPSTDGFIENPGHPGAAGAYFLHAQCTASKCRYSWKLVSTIIGDGDSNVGDI